jgi:phosphoglycerate dehydrogenase-like enzyme
VDPGFLGGFEHLYGLSLPDKGIRACNARGVFDVPIAEWCISLMVVLTRDLPGMFRNQQQRIWDQDARFQAEIRGATVGIWGYGGIGRETAQPAKCFGLKVWALHYAHPGGRNGLYVVPSRGDLDGTIADRTFLPAQRSEFLSGLDYLVLTMPLKPQTRGVVGAQELAALPKSAYILDPAWGTSSRKPLWLMLCERGESKELAWTAIIIIPCHSTTGFGEWGT